ncbi:hypothetical protein M0R72_02815 [Candidatus Pacearchaeota archaeon]|jgi:hypothetical protein|nr:hypothetical protein [Candidatus Pacearchaeota archaeon]
MTEDKLKTENNPVEENKTISLLNQILSYKGLIIGIAAVLTAAASWFKPPDITATKATYEVLSVKVNELTKTTEDLSKSIEDSHDEVSNLRAYIEGFNNGKLAGLSGNTQTITLPLVTKARKPKTTKTDGDGIVMSEEPPQNFWEPDVAPDVAQEAPKKSAPPAAAATLPPFDQVVRNSSVAAY